MSLEEEIEKTQVELGELITKPKLTSKLLGRPPFRFIHDIVSELTKETGFADGLYEGEELHSKAIKEKHAKIAYLDKLLQYLEQNGEPCEARPNKIAAGAEAELTNQMLQVRLYCLDCLRFVWCIQTRRRTAPWEEGLNGRSMLAGGRSCRAAHARR